MNRHFIAFWNVENLFAPEGFPEREPWLARRLASELAGWSQALLDTKLDQLASILCRLNGDRGPDLLGVCEIENAFVLRQLALRLNTLLPGRAYDVVHADATRDQRGIDTAFLFDSALYMADPNAVFSHFIMRRTGTRDITQATFTTRGGRDLILMCNHWPSRTGGAHESRGYRMTAGETLSYWHERIIEERGADVPIVAFGDFNDDPFDESMRIHARATRERGDVERAQTGRFYNLAWRYLEQLVIDRNGKPKPLHGTLYYGGDGHVFDQILVSRSLLLASQPVIVDEVTARIEAFPEMVDHRVAFGPIRFGLPKGSPAANINTAGFSDHFPVSVILVEA